MNKEERNGNTTYLTDLIGRLSEKENNIVSSSQSRSWNAHREAEKINDKAFIPDIIRLIEKEKKADKKQAAYFLLGHIVKNTSAEDGVSYLIQRVNKETNKYVLSTLLDRIRDIPKTKDLDLTPILMAIKSDKWLIRYSAIQSLMGADNSEAELALIEILSQSSDNYDLTYANSTLSYIGTARAIPYLEKHLKSRKRDVKDSADCAIKSIQKRTAHN